MLTLLVLVCKTMLERTNKTQDEIAKRLRDYLQATLHVQLNITPWNHKGRMPMFLAKEFDFWQADIFSAKYLFALVSDTTDATPAELEKRKDRLSKDIDKTIVFVFDHMSAYTRARMIEKAISFVVPNNQLYIPSLAIDLREHFRIARPSSSSSLSPAAQVVLFRHLLAIDHKQWSPSNMAKKLRYSAMSVGRAFEELTANGLATVISVGRSKVLELKLPAEQTFKLAQPLLRSPVKSSHLFRAPALPTGFYGTTFPQTFAEGGEMALAKHTMINPPRLPCFAVGPKDWKILQTGEYGPEVEYEEDANFSVDAWWYDPDIVTDEREADRLSLYMQFQNSFDERVASAASQLLESVSWFRE